MSEIEKAWLASGRDPHLLAWYSGHIDQLERGREEDRAAIRLLTKPRRNNGPGILECPVCQRRWSSDHRPVHYTSCLVTTNPAIQRSQEKT